MDVESAMNIVTNRKKRDVKHGTYQGLFPFQTQYTTACRHHRPRRRQLLTRGSLSTLHCITSRHLAPLIVCLFVWCVQIYQVQYIIIIIIIYLP